MEEYRTYANNFSCHDLRITQHAHRAHAQHCSHVTGIRLTRVHLLRKNNNNTSYILQKAMCSAQHQCYDKTCRMQMMHYWYIHVQIALTFTCQLTLEIFCLYANWFITPGSSLSMPSGVIGLQWLLAGHLTLSSGERKLDYRQFSTCKFPSEANRSSASQEISRILCIPNAHYHTHNSPNCPSSEPHLSSSRPPSPFLWYSF
jgi:hypothetical protein